MRTEAEQVRGLQVLAALVPGASIIMPRGYVDTPALRLGRREVVYAHGGYDGWSAGGAQLIVCDKSAEEAASWLCSQ